jgi:RNA polymerase sigma factor (sigma-70 family)
MTEGAEEVSWTVVLAHLLRAFDLGHRENGEVDEALLWNLVVARIRVIARQQLRGSGLGPEIEEDVTQNTLIRLRKPKVLAAIREARYPAAYIARIMRNEAIDRQRRAPPHETIGPDIAAPAEDDDRERRVRRLDELLRDLTVEERQLLDARFFRQLQIGQIAAEYGEPYSAVAKRLFRLIAKLRAKFEIPH